MDQPERVYILAGTCQQGERWARERGFAKPAIYHVVDHTSLLGLRPGTLHLVGTALRDRRGISQILDHAAAVGWTFERHQ